MTSFSYHIHTPTGKPEPLEPVSPAAVEEVLNFHRGIPGYAPTPLADLSHLAAELGVAKIWVKDESHRFGLNAFKALGGSYAIGKYLADRLGLPADETTFRRLQAPESKHAIQGLTFITATDGNHGRGVAWAAKELGCEAVVYMPQGSSPERLENIRALGAKAEILDLNYDDAVRQAAKEAEEKGWILVQDTTQPGYIDIPTYIMQGYTTLARECAETLEALGEQPPTHLFLQSGVGSLAGAVAGYAAARWGKRKPRIIVVEPDAADCLYQTARANDGTLHVVTGPMNSMMAGLCCGEPCTLGWEILNACANAFVSCSDHYTVQGMRLLGRPAGKDPKVVSGESGAVTAGVLAAVMTEDQLAGFRRELGLDETSRVLLISSEGDTDKANYRRIVDPD